MTNKELEALIRISESIIERYKQMASLEKEGKKESSEYASLVSSIKSSINLEENLMSNIEINQERIDFIEKEFKDYGYEDKENIADTIILNNQNSENNLHLARILLRLKTKLARDVKSTIEKITAQLLPPEIKDDYIIEEESIKSCANMVEITIGFRRDISLLLYKLLEDSISNEKNKNLKDYLIDYKYALIMLDSKLEEILMSTSFKGIESIYLESDLIGRILKVPTGLYDSQKYYVASHISEREILEIIKKYDYEYDAQLLKAGILFRSLILRSSIQLLTQEQSSKLISEITEACSSESYKSCHVSSKNLDLIQSCFDYGEKDLYGVNKLTLKG